MIRAAWRALSDPDAPLLGDDLPDLDADDGSTRWAVCLDSLTAEYGNGCTARMVVPAFVSGEPFRVVMLEDGTAASEGEARDTLDAMERADMEAEALGWHQEQAPPTAHP